MDTSSTCGPGSPVQWGDGSSESAPQGVGACVLIIWATGTVPSSWAVVRDIRGPSSWAVIRDIRGPSSWAVVKDIRGF